MKEDLTKAIHDSVFICDSLRSALNKANNVEALILIDLIEKANKLRINIEQFAIASDADQKSKNT
jgi:hypothetical protein